MSIQATFSLKFNHKFIPRTVTVGKFDGSHPSLTAATSNGKIVIHTPHGISTEAGGRLIKSEEGDISILNINQPIKTLLCTRLNLSISREVIVVGTPTHVFAYDIETNSDLFYKEVPDGANCLAVGKIYGVQCDPILIVGGNCAIQGYDYQGNDVFWTVTGDNVTSLCICDFDLDGKNELVVGSEDFEIRVFKYDELIAEMTETEAVTHLKTISGNRFAYALGNGTLGIYEGMNRIWRIKSKNQVMSIALYDIDDDNQMELVTGWSVGKIDFRKIDTGEVLVKETMPNCIAGIESADYRMDGTVQLIACSTEGEMRGYLPIGQGGLLIQEDDPGQELLRSLTVQKQNLVLELQNYQANKEAAMEFAANPASADVNKNELGIIPADTQLQVSLYTTTGTAVTEPAVEMYLGTTNETMVRCAMVFAEGVFAGESHVIHPNSNNLENYLKIRLRPEKDIAVQLHCKALVGNRNSIQFHVFELTRTLPKFSMYAKVKNETPDPEGYVKFQISERPQRIALWMNENFLFEEDVFVGKDGTLDVKLFSLRDMGLLFMNADATGNVTLRSDSIELCGELIQTLGIFLGIENMNSYAVFPLEVDKLLSLLDQANDLYQIRDRLSADMADHSQLIKGLIVRAEDARIMRDMRSTKKHYSELYSYNQELLGQYKVRCSNHEELLSCLKTVNQIVQKAARLRIGHFKTDIVNACRQAIKDGKNQIIPNIIKNGA